MRQQAHDVGFDLGKSKQGGQGQEEMWRFKRLRQTSDDEWDWAKDSEAK